MVIFDLEWNSGRYDPIRLDEILQFGAVKTARPGGYVEDSICLFVRPRIHRRFSPAAAALPELEQAKASSLDFPAAAQAFFEWCGGETVFAAWGANDFMALRQNLEYWHLDLPLPQTYLDLQAAFGHSIGTDASLSLEWAADYCRVPDIFDPHNALSDAIYAWAVCAHVSDSLLGASFRIPPVPGLRHPAASLPKRPRPWQGPFDGINAALNNWGCRRAVCPVCTRRFPVSRWACLDGGAYYAKFACPEHGSYLWRLETARDRASRLWANGAPLPMTAKNKALFQRAKEQKTVECHRKRRRRRRRSPPQGSSPSPGQ